MTRTDVCRGIVALCVVGLWVLSARSFAQTEQTLRPYRVEDQFAMESGGDHFTFSPKGRAVAFSRKRAIKTVPISAQSSLVLSETRMDIWLQDAPHTAPRNLTNGITDQSGWWAPKWSPDGETLAFLSSRGGNVTLWGWERRTDRIRQFSTEPVEFNGIFGGFRWIDNQRLLIMAMPEGEAAPPLVSYGDTPRLATEAWTSAMRGVVTAHVVNSTEFKFPSRRILLVETASGRVQLVATTSKLSKAAGWPTVWPSPDGRAVAFVRAASTQYSVFSLERLGMPLPVELRWLDGRAVSLDRSLPQNVLTDTVRWSPDGKELAFFAYGDAPISPVVLYGAAAAETMPDRTTTLQNPARLYRVSLASSEVVALETGEIDLGFVGPVIPWYVDPQQFGWTAAGELIMRAPKREFTNRLNLTPRYGDRGAVPIGPEPEWEWWVIGRDGRVRSMLTSDRKRPPKVLHPIDGAAAFLGIENGDVWRVDPVTGGMTNLTARFAPKVTSIVSTRAALSSRSPLAVTAMDGAIDTSESRRVSAQSIYLLDLRSTDVVAFPKVEPSATTREFDPVSMSMIFTGQERGGRLGAYAWRTYLQEEPELLLETNTFVREIQPPERKYFDYTSINGEALKGELTLPLGYQASRRYPLVAIIYPTFYVRPRIEKTMPGHDCDIFASAGYACLQPSLPINIPGLKREEGNSLLMVTDGLMPAVQQAITMGVADPNRLFVMGGSAGGWATAGVLGLTTRFKAAISFAGLYNEPSIFGPSGGLSRRFTDRYTDLPHRTVLPIATSAAAYGASDIPWWRDRERLRRNSPFTYLDRIQTPILIVHGDFDELPLDQAEEFFAGLAAMRKPAQLLRYWGEGHSIATPANLLDMWRRTLAWFDDYGDITRDQQGGLVFETGSVKSRKGGAALTADDFARFPVTASSTVNR
jgi:dipeptidyl aminopeptidase/acylaminoacyl peptidase